MANESRLLSVRDFIRSHGEVSIGELQSFYSNYSAMTLWRDLKLLEEQGCIRRVHGGAISMLNAAPQIEGVYSKRARERILEKTSISKAALAFITPGHAVYLDAGSTLMSVANLMGSERYTVVTSGANIAIELSQRHTCDVLLTGGQISENTLSCSGEQAESFINSINIDVALMATSGFSLASGFTSGSHSESVLKKNVIQKAAKTVMLMDASKVNRSLPFTFATLSDVDVLICDDKLPKDILSEAKRQNVTCIVAESN
ncbi:MAG: DeoR/GlpR family DNA-binding transcription regulator [Clostridia bacterium]